MNMTTKPIALVIDDTPANRDFLERLLTLAGFDVRGAGCGKDGLACVAGLEDLPLAVIDMQLPDIAGLQLTYDLRKRFPNVYIVVATVHDERSLIDSVFQKGGNCFLVKPHGFMELYKRLTTVTLEKLRNSGYVIVDQNGPRVYKFAAR
jgi:CheY-like chemotaxis protein